MKLNKLVAFLVATGAVSPAIADPVSAALALGSAFAASSGYAIVALALTATSAVYSSAQARRQKRRAEQQARDSYNASLQDRSVSTLRAIPPWQIVYGRCVTGGSIRAIITSDKTGTRSDGTTYTHADALKHLVISVADHEVQDIHELFIDGVAIGPVDGSGWATTGEFAGSVTIQREVTVAAGASSVQPYAVTVLRATPQSQLNGEGTPGVGSYTVTGGNTINNTDIEPLVFTFTMPQPNATVRWSKHLGADTQTVDTYLNGVAPTEWTANHRLRGIAYVVLTLDLENTRFQGGPPNITFDVSGKKLYDPRTATTVFSRNTALAVRDYLKGEYGYGCVDADINDTYVIAAANACDARSSAAVHGHAQTFTADAATDALTFATDMWFGTGDGVRFTTTGTLPAGLSLATTYYAIRDSATKFRFATSVANAFSGTAINITTAGTGTHTGTLFDYATYTLDGVVTTEDNKSTVVSEFAEAMCGQVSYGATWLMQAGAWSASVMDLTENDLMGQISLPQSDSGLDTLFNTVKGTYIPDGKSQPQDFDKYQNATFLSDDGAELVEDMPLRFTNSKIRAANIARIRVEQNRSGQVIRVPCKLKAWPLQVGDRIRVTNAEYGFSLKYFRITDWTFDPRGPVVITAQEDDATIYDLADAVDSDPTPNTNLPNPWVVAAPSGVAANSGTGYLFRQSDGTIVSRVRVTWTMTTNAYMADANAKVLVIWRRIGRDVINVFTTEEVAGDETGAYINGVTDGDVLLIGVQFQNALGVLSSPVWITHVVVGKTAVPGDVAGLTATPAPGGINLTWTQNTEADYYNTELRFGASWAAGTLITGVAGSAYFWPRPTTSGFTIWAKHQDTTGNYSSGTASVSSAALSESIPSNWDFASGTADGWSNIDSVASTSDASGGYYGIASTPAAEYITGRRVPISLDRKYRVRVRVRRPSGGTGVGIIIVGATCYDSAGALINNPGGTGFPATATTASGVTVPNNNTWMVLEGEISGVNTGSSPWPDMKKFWPGTVTAAPNIYWDATFNGNLHIDYVEIVDVTDANVSVAQSFSAFRTWDFNGSIEGWTPFNFSVVQGATGVTLTPTAVDPAFYITGLSIPGAIYDKVRIRVRRTNAGTSWDGTLYYEVLGSHTWNAGFQKNLPFSSMPGDQFAVLEFDMADLTAGGTDWRDSVITGLRFDLPALTGTDFEIDWISVGRYGPAGDLAQVSNSTWVANSLMTMFGDRAVRTSLAAGAWSGQVYSLDAYTGGAYITGVAQRVGDGVFIGLNTDPTTDGNYTSIDYAIHWNSAGNLYAYSNGTALNGGVIISTYVPGDVLGVFYDGQFIRYTKNGATLFTQPAPSAQLKLYADSSFYQAGSSVGGLTFGPMTNSSISRGSNLIDASWWAPGVSPLSRWTGNQAGAGASDDFVPNQLPDGSTQIVWRATQGAGAGPGGGWEQVANDGNNAPIDPSKSYMFAVLFRKVSGANDTSLWWGIGGSTVCDLNTTTLNSNPYFAGGFNPLGVVDRWYLAIGWVYPYGSTGHNHAQAGVWDTLTGAKVHDGLNWNWAQATQRAITRAYQYYATAGNQAAFARPQAYLCDGSQPTLRDLLSSVSNYGQDAMRVGFFNGWTGTFPDGWQDWANGATLIKETARVRTAPYAVKWTNISTEQGLVSTNEFVGAPRAEGDYIEGEFEAFIESNSGAGYPGILVRAFFAGGLTLFEDLFVPVTNLVAGQWQRVPFKHSLQPGRSICAVHIYMMASWSAAPGGNSNCTVIFDNIQYRFQKEINTNQLVNEAATVALTASNLSTQVVNSTSAAWVDLTLNTLAWTNNTGGSVAVQVEHSMTFYTVNSGNGKSRAVYEWSISGGGGAGAEAIENTVLTLGTPLTPYAKVQQIVVPAGLTLTVNLIISAWMDTGTFFQTVAIDSITRLTAIKR